MFLNCLNSLLNCFVLDNFIRIVDLEIIALSIHILVTFKCRALGNYIECLMSRHSDRNLTLKPIYSANRRWITKRIVDLEIIAHIIHILVTFKCNALINYIECIMS